MVLLGETNGSAIHKLCASIGGHNQNHVAEICFAAIVIGQGAVIHHL